MWPLIFDVCIHVYTCTVYSTMFTHVGSFTGSQTSWLWIQTQTVPSQNTSSSDRHETLYPPSRRYMQTHSLVQINYNTAPQIVKVPVVRFGCSILLVSSRCARGMLEVHSWYARNMQFGSVRCDILLCGMHKRTCSVLHVVVFS